MRILFRLDANAQIGAGHLMRCLSLAAELKRRGGSCVFLCRSEGMQALQQRIASEGHTLLPLPTATNTLPDKTPPSEHEPLHAPWLPGGWRQDVAACQTALDAAGLADNTPFDWLVVDHYALDHRWESALRSMTERLMVIDDLADRKHDCDLLLDQNLALDPAQRYDGLLAATCQRLLGPRYALLRPEFARKDEEAPRAPAKQPRLLVMFGGADPQQVTLRVVKVLLRMGWQGVVDVVVGPLYADVDSLHAAVAGLAAGRLHVAANHIAELMRAADLAIGAPGSASWERCACGLPALTLALAANQEPIGVALGQSGANFYLGRATDLSDEDLLCALKIWSANDAARMALRMAASALCDGLGAGRTADKMIVKPLVLRRVCLADAEVLFAWRNDERTRRMSLNPQPLDFSSHIRWLEQKLADSRTHLLLASNDEAPVACIRFDVDAKRVLTSIYVDPARSGQGFGGRALHSALVWLRQTAVEIERVEAEVLATNAASHALFQAAGFVAHSTRYQLDLNQGS